MTDGVMTIEAGDNENFSSEQRPSKRRSFSRVVVGCGVLVVVAVAIGVGVSLGRNKTNDQQGSSSLSSSSSSVTSPGGDAPTTTMITATSNPTTSPTAETTTIPPTPSPSNIVTTTTATTDSPMAAVSLTGEPTTVSPTDVPTTAPPTATASTASPGELVEGTTSNGIAYLRCSRGAAASDLKQVVLLHGSSYTKEIWESGDMLPNFCAGAQTVVALDLSVSTDYAGLIDVLDDLKTGTDDDSQHLTTKPVTLVTPSASGYSVVSWIMNGDVTKLAEYISEWVPVATGSLVSASDEQIAALKGLSGFRILAINGNDDTAGGKYSTRLAELAGATAVELVGRHAVYLQSPDDFVSTILEF